MPVPDFVYVHDLDPFLFRVRLFGYVLGLRWYGLAYVTGFALTSWYFWQAGHRNAVKGLTTAMLEHLLVAVVVGVLVGGRLGFVLQHPRQLLSDPLFIVRIWEGGMAFFGGLAGVLIALSWVAWRHRLRFLELTDVALFPAVLGLALGRLANFVNAELVGKPTGSAWGVIFPSVDTVPRHPYQLYAFVSHLVLFAVLLGIQRARPGWVRAREGRLSYLFLALYGALRFITDFYREDDTFLGPWSTGQWASLLVSLMGVLLLCQARKNTKHTISGRQRHEQPAHSSSRTAAAGEGQAGDHGAGTAAMPGENETHEV